MIRCDCPKSQLSSTATEIEQGESDAREVVEFVLEALTQPRVAQ